MATGVLPTQLSAAPSSYEEKPAVYTSPLNKSENKVKIPGRSLFIIANTNNNIKMEPLGKVNFQWTKILYQNILSHIAFLFTLSFARAIDGISYP